MTGPARRADHAPYFTPFHCPDCQHPYHQRRCAGTKGQPCGCER